MRKIGFFTAIRFTLTFVIISAALVSVSVVSSNVFLSEQTSAPADTGYVIVLDAGHGGIDGGAQGDDGTLEKDLNLAVTRRLFALFDSAGVNVVMTRDADVSLGAAGSSHRKLDDLKARVQTAEQTENAVFVSIHMNKFPVSRYSGLQVYYSKNNPLSKTLAESVQSTVRVSLQPKNSREIKSAGSDIYVLNSSFCPAILVECGFLSNENELADLCDENYQKRLAACIFAAVTNTLERKNTTV